MKKRRGEERRRGRRRKERKKRRRRRRRRGRERERLTSHRSTIGNQESLLYGLSIHAMWRSLHKHYKSLQRKRKNKERKRNKEIRDRMKHWDEWSLLVDIHTYIYIERSMEKRGRLAHDQRPYTDVKKSLERKRTKGVPGVYTPKRGPMW